MNRSTRNFEHLILPWLDAGYNLARWLVHDDAAASDVLQEASLKAFRYLDKLQGDDARPWFLGIVRNACYTHLQQQRGQLEVTGFDDDALDLLHHQDGHHAPDPASLLHHKQDVGRVNRAIQALPAKLREVIVLRELECLEYADIAQVAGIPVGTVMSRLSRARARLKDMLLSPQEEQGR